MNKKLDPSKITRYTVCNSGNQYPITHHKCLLGLQTACFSWYWQLTLQERKVIIIAK